MASIKDLISRLKKLKKRVLEDQEGWFRGGKFTPVQHIKEGVESRLRNLRAWEQVIRQPEMRKEYQRLVIKPATSRAVQKIRTSQILPKLFPIAPAAKAVGVGLAKQIYKPLKEYGRFVGAGLIQSPTLLLTRKSKYSQKSSMGGN